MGEYGAATQLNKMFNKSSNSKTDLSEVVVLFSAGSCQNNVRRVRYIFR